MHTESGPSGLQEASRDTGESQGGMLANELLAEQSGERLKLKPISAAATDAEKLNEDAHVVTDLPQGAIC